MITINLAPTDELESKFWYAPDLITIALVACLSWFSVQFYLGQVEEEIANITLAKEELERNTERLKPDLDRFDQLNHQVDVLKEKLRSLRRITISRIERYKPIIILEHLQNLKPDGVWFTSLRDDSKNHVISVQGGAFDNLLVAEFMAALEATRQQGIDKNNIRTQVFFSSVFLEQVSSDGATAAAAAGGAQLDGEGKPIKDEQAEKAKAAFNGAQDKNLAVKRGNDAGAGTAPFPEIAKFPKFELNVKYAERALESEAVELK